MKFLDSTRADTARRFPLRPLFASVLLVTGAFFGQAAVAPAADRTPSADRAGKEGPPEAPARPASSAPLPFESAVPALLQAAVARLRQEIENGPPFSLTERKRRIDGLEKLLAEPGVDIAEKYRRVLEAYRAELEYGKTVEAYRDLLRTEEGERLVDFLSIGRLALYYQTLDGRESGMWDDRDRQWHRLAPRYDRAIALGLRAARKLEPPQLLSLPLPGPRSPSP